MTPDMLLNLIIGPASGVVILALGLYALTRGKWVVPWAFYAACEERGKVLEEENRRLNNAIIKLTEQNGGLREDIAGLRVEIEYLKQEVARYIGSRDGERAR